jgi:capsular polysaccharide transport system permease protein
MSNFAAALRVQFRVISAIILREVGSRHGGDAVGTFWLLLEPIIITLIVVAIHQASGAAILQSGPVVVLLLTGYVPHLMFRHGGLAGIAALTANSGLLYHRQVHFVVIAHPTWASGSVISLAARTKRSTPSTEAPLAFAVLTTERKAA